jgi:hypothetical protein
VSEIRSSLDGIGLAQYGAESVERLGIVLLIGTLHLFLELADIAIGFQLSLVAADI